MTHDQGAWKNTQLLGTDRIDVANTEGSGSFRKLAACVPTKDSPENSRYNSLNRRTRSNSFASLRDKWIHNYLHRFPQWMS